MHEPYFRRREETRAAESAPVTVATAAPIAETKEPEQAPEQQAPEQQAPEQQAPSLVAPPSDAAANPSAEAFTLYGAPPQLDEDLSIPDLAAAAPGPVEGTTAASPTQQLPQVSGRQLPQWLVLSHARVRVSPSFDNAASNMVNAFLPKGTVVAELESQHVNGIEWIRHSLGFTAAMNEKMAAIMQRIPQTASNNWQVVLARGRFNSASYLAPVYAEPSFGSQIVSQLKSGSEITASEVREGWVHHGQGWTPILSQSNDVLLSQLEGRQEDMSQKDHDTISAAVEPASYVTTKPCWVRNEPSTQGASVVSLKTGHVLSGEAVPGERGTWLKHSRGYTAIQISEDVILEKIPFIFKPSQTWQVVFNRTEPANPANVPVYTEPRFDAQVLGTLNSGETVVQLDRNSNWVRHAQGWTPIRSQEGDVLISYLEAGVSQNAAGTPVSPVVQQQLSQQLPQQQQQQQQGSQWLALTNARVRTSPSFADNSNLYHKLILEGGFLYDCGVVSGEGSSTKWVKHRMDGLPMPLYTAISDTQGNNVLKRVDDVFSAGPGQQWQVVVGSGHFNRKDYGAAIRVQPGFDAPMVKDQPHLISGDIFNQVAREGNWVQHSRGWTAIVSKNDQVILSQHLEKLVIPTQDMEFALLNRARTDAGQSPLTMQQFTGNAGPASPSTRLTPEEQKMWELRGAPPNIKDFDQFVQMLNKERGPCPSIEAYDTFLTTKCRNPKCFNQGVTKCPVCAQMGRTYWICSQKCFQAMWPSHSISHQDITQTKNPLIREHTKIMLNQPQKAKMCALPGCEEFGVRPCTLCLEDSTLADKAPWFCTADHWQKFWKGTHFAVHANRPKPKTTSPTPSKASPTQATPALKVQAPPPQQQLTQQPVQQAPVVDDSLAKREQELQSAYGPPPSIQTVIGQQQELEPLPPPALSPPPSFGNAPPPSQSLPEPQMNSPQPGEASAQPELLPPPTLAEPDLLPPPTLQPNLQPPSTPTQRHVFMPIEQQAAPAPASDALQQDLPPPPTMGPYDGYDLSVPPPLPEENELQVPELAPPQLDFSESQ